MPKPRKIKVRDITNSVKVREIVKDEPDSLEEEVQEGQFSSSRSPRVRAPTLETSPIIVREVTETTQARETERPANISYDPRRSGYDSSNSSVKEYQDPMAAAGANTRPVNAGLRTNDGLNFAGANSLGNQNNHHGIDQEREERYVGHEEQSNLRTKRKRDLF